MGLCETIKQTNLHIMLVPEVVDKEKGEESLLKEKKKWQKIPKSEEGNYWIHEAQITVNKVYIYRSFLRHNISKFSKVKTKIILKEARGKEVNTYKENSTGLTADFSAEAL